MRLSLTSGVRVAMLAVAAMVMFVSCASAQTVTSTSKLMWDQQAPDLATAQAYDYRLYPDGAATVPTPVVGVTCSGTASPFVCVVPFPAFTPGSHTEAATAANSAGESLKSTVFAFQFVVIPSPPQNLRKGN